ncbi:hypothetical protein [Amnibacterium endophyticum]|uniref:Type IV toxin-antitoxin system AbiEi family antitoxin domain-containing protein n=1 Tax=Amnibacterium endophyticum TaxID=2109337 RepID=A0ABW4LB36_9MICO
MAAVRAREHLVLRHRNRLADERSLQRAAAKGLMTRLRSGAYVPTAIWASLSPDERRRLEAVTAAEMNPDYIASHRSAAALWRVPTIRPSDGLVHARVTAAAGSRTEHGVRKHAVRDLALHLTHVDGVPVTTLVRTVLDLAATEPFEEAVVAMDWALGRGLTKRELHEALEEWGPVRGRRRIEGVIDFADARSGSAGESFSRVLMAEAKLPAPVLQQPFEDGDGLIGFVDFWWPEHNRIGEFDGLKKYREPELLQGRAPGEVVSLEKVREDRLRATPTRPDVSRWIWAVLQDQSLGWRLAAAGLPRVGRSRA